MLEFRVLGGLAVENGDGAAAGVNVGGPRQRRLVAMLLLNRNCVVSADRLADVVFAGEPSAAAATTLRSYVARLRRVVECEDSGCRVVTQAPGYRLEVADDAIDDARFEAAVERGRTLLGQGDPGRAAQVLRTGLALWRGDAWAEFADEEWAQGDAIRLGELRLVAYEGLADAELSAGRPGEAVALLDGLVADHPLRESLRARMMLALYRSGRHVEALRAYQEHRDVLAAEVGVEPSPELVELEGRILAHDDALQLADADGSALRGYRLGERLGTGREGTVFAARLPGVDRDIAIRALPPDIADDPDFVRTFDADARRVASLGHEAVVPVGDWWREPGAAYVVMRRLRGGTLRDRLQRGRLSADEAAALVSRVGGALVAAAEAGITHGRVTAGSVLFDAAGASYLGDFPLGTRRRRDQASDMVALAALVGAALRGPAPGPTSPTADRDGDARQRDLARTVSDLVRPPSPGSPPSATPAALADFVTAAASALAGAPVDDAPARVNPYVGLRAFDEPDADHFFGRDRVVDDIVDRLAAADRLGRLALVVGASGCGKSSLVRAGLLPRVRAGAVPGAADWFVATMVPGRAPLAELADALREVAVVDAAGALRQLQAGEEGLHRLVTHVVPAAGQLLLIVDQLEELFTLAPPDDQRAFLDALAFATAAPDSRLRVVATLRADFYDRPLRHERFGAAVGDATVAVGAMSAAELEAAVVGPAERVGVTVEPALVAEVVGAVLHEPAALPSMQFTLAELADRGTGTIGLDAYRALGGVDGAIAARAEELVMTLAPADRAGVRRMFEQLVVVGPEGEPTRRRTLLSEVATVLAAPGGGGTEEVEAWARARLLTLDRHPDSRAPTVEVAHEALLREWPRLRDWVEEDREAIVALGRLRDAAAGWESLGRDPGALYRGVRLDEALRVVGDGDRRLQPADRSFLDASRLERDRERRDEAERVHNMARTNGRLRAQLAAVALALVVALVVGAVAVGQRGRAARQSRLAEARELAAAANANLDVDPERSVLLALAAVDRSRHGEGGAAALPEAEEALHRAVTASRIDRRFPGIGGAVAWSPAGDTFVTEGPEDSGLVDIRDARTGESVRSFQGHAVDVNDVAYNADGTLLATTGDDGAVRVWDPATGRQVQAVTAGSDAQVWGPSISPDGSLFAASWPEENVTRVAETATGRVVREVRSAPYPFRTAFAPDGHRFAVAAGEGAGVVVDVRTGDELLTLAHPVLGMNDIAWSPDGTSIVTSGDDGSARVWDADTGEQKFVLLGHRGRVTDAAWSPDSNFLATVSEDGTAKLWVLTEGGPRELYTLSAQDTRDGLAGVAFSPDGTELLTGATDIGAAQVWDVSGNGDAEVANLPAVTYLLNAMAYSADGRILVAPGSGGSASVWDAGDRHLVRALGGRPQPADPAGPPPVLGPDDVHRLGLDAHGTTLAATTGPAFDTVREWDVATGRQLFALRLEGAIFRLALSPDGQTLAVALEQSDPGTVIVVDRAGHRVGTLREQEGVAFGDIEFGAGGRLVAGRIPIDPDGSVEPGFRVWDWRTGKVVGGADTGGWSDVATGGERVTSIDAAPDGANSLGLWTVGGERVATLRGMTGAVQSMEVSADGSQVAAGSGDGTVRVWNVGDGDEPLVLRGHIGGVSAVAFRAGGSELASASADGSVRIWAIGLDHLVDIAEAGLTRSLTDGECRRYLHVHPCPGG